MKNNQEDVKSILSDLAKAFGNLPITNEEYIEKLRSVGFKGDVLTNNSLIIASVFSNAVQGDMNAVNKWQELTSILIKKEDTDEIGDIIAEREADGKPTSVR